MEPHPKLQYLLASIACALCCAALIAMAVLAILFVWMLLSETLPVVKNIRFEYFLAVAGAATALLALFSGLLTFHFNADQNRKQARMQHTVTVLFDTRMSDGFRKDLQNRKRHFTPGERVDPDRFRRYLNGQGDAETSLKSRKEKEVSAEAAINILNFWENIAALIAQNDLDKAVLKETVRGQMCNFVSDFSAVAGTFQNNDDRTYRHLIDLYESWRDESHTPIPAA